MCGVGDKNGSGWTGGDWRGAAQPWRLVDPSVGPSALDFKDLLYCVDTAWLIADEHDEMRSNHAAILTIKHH